MTVDLNCRKCQNQQTPDHKLFTNTWIGGSSVVPKSYLIYRWVTAGLTLLFLGESLYRRIVKEEDWRYWLYLTSWVRILGFFTNWLEASLVTARWRRERQGHEEVYMVESYASSTSSPLPLSHRVLWILSNVTSTISLLCSLVYWAFFYTPGLHPLDLQNLSGHAFVTLLSVLDVFISARPWRCLHAFHSQLFCLAYSLSNFAYIQERGTDIYQQSHYLYSILDWSRPSQCLLTILGFTLLMPFIHTIFIILYKIRDGMSRWQLRKRQRQLQQLQQEEGEVGRLALLTHKL